MSNYEYKYITGRVTVIKVWNSQDISGEWGGGGIFHLKLKKPIKIVGLDGKEALLDTIRLNWGDWLMPLEFTNGSSKHGWSPYPVPTALHRDIYHAISRAEEGRGKLKDYCFSDELYSSAYPKKGKRL